MSLLHKSGGIWRDVVEAKVHHDGIWKFVQADAKLNGEWENSGANFPFQIGADAISPGVFGMQSNFSRGDSYLQMIGTCTPSTFITPSSYIGPIYANLPYLIHEISSDNNKGQCSLTIESLFWPNAPSFGAANGQNIAFHAVVIQTISYQTVTLLADDATMTDGNGPTSFQHTPKFTWEAYLGWEGTGLRNMRFIWI